MENHGLNQFVPWGLNSEKHTNLVLNFERQPYLTPNFEISPQTLPQPPAPQSLTSHLAAPARSSPPQSHHGASGLRLLVVYSPGAYDGSTS